MDKFLAMFCDDGGAGNKKRPHRPRETKQTEQAVLTLYKEMLIINIDIFYTFFWLYFS